MTRSVEGDAAEARRELILVQGPFDGIDEGSLAVLAREVRDHVADESYATVRVRVKVVDDHVLVTIEKDGTTEVMLRV